MPKLNKELQAQRIAQALQALSLTTQGMSQVEACMRAGISEDQFRHWISRGGEALEAFRVLLAELQRRQLVQMMSGEEKALSLLLADMINPSTPPKVRLEIKKYVDSQIEKLSHDFGVDASSEEDARDYLNGPKLEKAGSRLVATVNVDPRDDGSIGISITRQGDIIDGTSYEPSDSA